MLIPSAKGQEGPGSNLVGLKLSMLYDFWDDTLYVWGYRAIRCNEEAIRAYN